MRILRFALCLLAVGVALATPLSAQDPTTVILVRHAEKGRDLGDGDPELSEAGRDRARTLAYTLGELDIGAIYSTPYLRTQHTVQPLADRLGIEITITPVTRTSIEDMVRTLREDHEGDVVLVVGHSNTIPPLVNALGAGPFENLADHDYDDLFVVTLTDDGRASAVRLRYGKPTP